MSYQISGTPLHNSYLDFSIIGNIIIQNVDLNIGAKMIKIIKGCKELSTFIKDAINIRFGYIMVIVCLTIFSTGLNSITIPYISKYLLDSAIVSLNVSILYKVLILALLVYFAYLICDIFLTYFILKWQTDVDFSFKCNFYKVINKKKSLELEGVSPMDIYYRMFNDGQVLIEYLFKIYVTIPSAILFCIVIYVLMMRWSVILSLYTLVLVGINIIGIIFFQKPIKDADIVLKKINQSVAEYVLEKLELLPFSQTNNIWKWWGNNIKNEFAYAQKATIKNAFIMKLLSNITEFLKQLWSIGYIILGVYLIFTKHISVGSFFGFQSLALYFITPFNKLVLAIYSYQNAKVSYDRYKEYYNLDNIKNGNITNISVCSGLYFKNIFFTYPKSKRIIFNGFSASFKSGQISAIIGDNGKGKSTLMYLATRLYTPQSGNILINDIDINSICLEKYYGMISFMQQDSVVFNDTFINNLVLGKVYSEEEIDEVMEICDLYKIVNRLPQKMNTILGIDGVKLSGGEARRLALARILIRHPYIIWLDEPTASIDDEAVMHIILALKKFTYKYHMVTLVNTHDGRIVKEADYSIVL